MTVGVRPSCDPRLATASYRGPFLKALPVEPELWRDVRGLAEAAARFLSDEGLAAQEDD